MQCIKETRISLSLTQQQLADRALVGIATVKRIEKGGSLNLDTLISILRALNKLQNLDAILFEAEMRNFNENSSSGEGQGDFRCASNGQILNQKFPSPARP